MIPRAPLPARPEGPVEAQPVHGAGLSEPCAGARLAAGLLLPDKPSELSRRAGRAIGGYLAGQRCEFQPHRSVSRAL